MSILIKNVLFNDKTIDIYIEGKEIKQIGAGLSFPADKILDGSRKAVIPGFGTLIHMLPYFVPRLRR